MECNDYCRNCLLGKRLKDVPAGADPARISEYERRVREIVSRPGETSPEKDYQINLVHDELFGVTLDYRPVKRHFNQLMMTLMPQMLNGVEASRDPLRRAIQYAMTGNFIDFAVMENVDEDKLRRLIDDSDGFKVDEDLLSAFRAEILSARRSAYILDNCGEIVMDRVLMQVMKRLNPELSIAAVVKGDAIVNDATRQDAEQVRLLEVAQEIIDTGCGIAGVPQGRISEACRDTLKSADLIISKGQANYETLCGCGLNIYYIFMCKCQLFMDRFHVPQFSGLIIRERDDIRQLEGSNGIETSESKRKATRGKAEKSI